MTTLFGFILFCCVAWWWVRGVAFVAFCLGMLWAVLNEMGASDHGNHYSLGGVIIGLAIIALPWLIRTTVLPGLRQRSTPQRELSHLGLPRPLLRVQGPTVER